MSKCMRSTRYYKRDPKYNSLFTTKKASDSVGVSAGSPPAAMAMARSDRYSAPESETDDSVCNPVDTGSTAVVRHDWIKASDERFVALGVYVLRAVTSYGLPNALRMTVGSDEANEGVIATLTEFMKSE